MFTLLGGWAVLSVLVALMVGGINLLLAVLMEQTILMITRRS